MKIYYSKNFDFCKDKMQYSYELLCHVMCKYEGLPENFRVHVTRRGKPYLADYDDRFFSISHTGELWICAVSDREIGIDVEYEDRKVKNVEKLVNKYFTQPEKEYYDEIVMAKETDIDYAFIETWTRREAFLKYHGAGIGDDILPDQEYLYTAHKNGAVVTICRKSPINVSDIKVVNIDG